MYDYLRIFLACGFAWTAAQLTKVIIGAVKKEKVNFFVSGGMPSSHTASVMALTTRVGFIEGFDSSVFAACIIFSIVIMFDAANVRQAVGMQTERINTLTKKLYGSKDANGKVEEIKEVKGHNYKEVVAGLILGVVVGCIFSLVEKAVL